MSPLVRRFCAALFLTAAIASAADDIAKLSPSASLADAIKLFEAHQLVEAQVAFEKVADAEPRNAEAAEIRKRDPVRGAQAFGTLYVAEKEYAKAFLMFDEMIKAHPGNKLLLYYLGSVAASSGQQLDRGEAALKEYLKSTPAANEPGLFVAHWRLGVIYEKKGNKDAARAEYEAALKLWPQYPPALAALKKLQ
jgi:tetratricopeptide (TPR) repeat protein